MTVTFLGQLCFLLWSLAAGGAIAMLYDILRTSRRVVKTPDAVVTLSDALFILAATALLLCTAFFKNGGEVRWYGIAAAVLSFALYKLIFKDFFVRLFVKVAEILKRIIIFLLKIIFFPVRIIFKIFGRPVRFIAWHTGKLASSAKARARVARDRAFIKAKSEILGLRKK